ncbi:hypothetical protein [Microbacterium capsulatum]|uniref:Uncharacterized protein n=1 Tax=Microbacterium capsulatum TaxID=3041921 RepID=A0ABU0XLY8_9MICO|nr:hypothetical protein [Microbacterium sp. ASV81]MDQ4214745.1 hypothetical protein [Microbacterium sp. ASV81]
MSTGHSDFETDTGRQQSDLTAWGTGATVWTNVRRELAVNLKSRDQDAAELYETAIQRLVSPLTRASLMVISHCVRELIKVLPVILGYPVVERADASRSARELHRHWVAASLQLDAEQAIEAAAVSVPSEVFVAARDAAIAGADGSKNSRELTAIIVTGFASEVDTASVARVHKSIEFFRGLAHARDYTQPAKPVPKVDRVIRELEIIEEALMNRMTNMADRAKTVRELLANANRKRDEAGQ